MLSAYNEKDKIRKFGPTTVMFPSFTQEYYLGIVFTKEHFELVPTSPAGYKINVQLSDPNIHG